MKHTFGLSWDHGKRKLVAAVALLLVAFALAAAPTAASIESRKVAEVGATVEIQSTSFTLRGSTWG